MLPHRGACGQQVYRKCQYRTVSQMWPSVIPNVCLSIHFLIISPNLTPESILLKLLIVHLPAFLFSGYLVCQVLWHGQPVFLCISNCTDNHIKGICVVTSEGFSCFWYPYQNDCFKYYLPESRVKHTFMSSPLDGVSAFKRHPNKEHFAADTLGLVLGIDWTGELLYLHLNSEWVLHSLIDCESVLLKM